MAKMTLYGQNSAFLSARVYEIFSLIWILALGTNPQFFGGISAQNLEKSHGCTEEFIPSNLN